MAESSSCFEQGWNLVRTRGSEVAGAVIQRPHRGEIGHCKIAELIALVRNVARLGK